MRPRTLLFAAVALSAVEDMTSRDADKADEGESTRPLRSFGRRRSHKLSPRQDRLLTDVLPRLRVMIDSPPPQRLTDLFSAAVDEVWLEIGFGGAEHLVWQAEHAPRAGIIGAEPFVNGVVKLLDAVEQRRLGNVRVWDEDVRPLLDWLPDACLDRVFVLYPDPWPKLRHRKRRLVTEALLAEIARVLKPGGELRMATDIADYAAQMLEEACHVAALVWQAESAADWRSRPDDWPQTRYEQKAVRARRQPIYLIFRRG